jgi:pimeloyl-ACP methyl ester carboxylesterase
MLIADIIYPLDTHKIVLSDGVSLAYTNVGQGFPLVFVHGLGSCIPAWIKNISFLSQYYRCLALDLPGYGKSSKLGFTAGMKFYAQIVSDFLDRMQIPACYLVGHSMGGQVAIHTALKCPEKIKKLALLAPAGIETFNEMEAAQLKSWFEAEKVYKAGAEIVERNIKANFHCFSADALPILQDRLQYKECDDYNYFCQAIADSVEAMLKEPVYNKLQELLMPVLILFGKQDAYIPSQLLHPRLELETILKEAINGIPLVSYHLIDFCGHFVQWEQAERVNNYLLDFLRHKKRGN